jgi:hypothetical protein
MMSVSSLCNKYVGDELIIPEHQRNFVWPEKVQQVFIDSLLAGMPCPSILMYEERRQPLSLEDGSQRLRTIVNFRNNVFGSSPNPGEIPAVKYSELSESARTRFDEIRLAVIVYSNATEEQRIIIFDRFQNGSPLKVGERLHSLSYTTLVKTAIRMLLTPGDGFHDRAIAVWGPRLACDNKDNRYESLINAVAMIAGCAHGSQYMSKKYADLRQVLLTPINVPEVVKIMTEVLNIYEIVHDLKPVKGKKILNKQWPLGNFTGYIINSLTKFPDEWPRLRVGWIQFLVDYRRDTGVLKLKLQRNLSAARFWCTERWNNGYANVFEGAIAVANDDEDEDEDEPDEDSDE